MDKGRVAERRGFSCLQKMAKGSISGNTKRISKGRNNLCTTYRHAQDTKGTGKSFGTGWVLS